MAVTDRGSGRGRTGWTIEPAPLSSARQRVSALDQAAASYQEAYALARTNFEAGATALVDLLDADRQHAAARLQAASARNDAAKAWATLQIATGAGAAVAGTPKVALR
ncbi:TolC family protein [Sulfitobacter sp. 20_GPM-1509m]|uniref:TolC family protein n=1 Tax=Sulfitobacter sp. 20_GPM-1509m TaxID=1380367 RepID=UPI0020C79401|nr:TolC family protein [Sulfitobacter sp. 20_GPM-1509m]